MFPIMILAGGKATRLYPLTLDTPKSMLEFNGKLFIEYQLELLKNSGFTHVCLCLGELAEPIIDFVNKNTFGMNITITVDKNPLGTGGAIKRAIRIMGYSNFFVIYGDSFLNMKYKDMQKIFLGSEKISMMGVYKNDNQFDKSNVKIIDKNTLLYKKSNAPKDYDFIDSGVSIFNKKVFDGFVEDAFPLSYVQEKLSRKNDISPYIIKDRFYEVGSVEGIQEFQKYLDKKK